MMYMQLTGLCTLSNESLARQKTCQLIAAVCCLHAATNAHTTDLQSVSNVLLVTARVARMYKFCLVCLCVCPSVCVYVTLWYSIETAKQRITQMMPHDSQGL